MPKTFTRRRIDGKPPRIRRGGAGGGGGGGTQLPTQEITTVRTFSGAGDPDQIDTFTVTGGLQAGDIYLVAFAFDGNGHLDFSPYDPLGGSNSYGVTSSGYYVGVQAWEVGAAGSGATSFTVTTIDEASAYHGWLLRGARTSLEVEDTVGDFAYFTITRPGGCGSPSDPVATYWQPMPAIVTPAEAGAFGIYACGVRADVCTGIPGTLVPVGGVSVASDPHLVAPLRYDFGTLDTSWEVTATTDGNEDGVICSASILVVYPAE
jgi:hypothetical protein